MIDPSFPMIADLKRRAHKRIPFYAWEYLDSGTGAEEGQQRNRNAFADISLVPRFMKGEFTPDTRTTIVGQEFAAPFGVAPVGLSSLMWPGAERILAMAAARHQIPYCLSTVANEPPEIIGPVANGYGWFQLYPPRNPELRRDMVSRAQQAGFSALIVTADVPTSSRRERQVRAGLSIPPKITPQMLWQSAIRPRWSLETLKNGQPRFKTLEKYVDATAMQGIIDFMGKNLGGNLDWEYLKALRDEWSGPILLKGILSADDAVMAKDLGLDGVIVSNHGARQFDGAPATLTLLPAIRQAVGSDYPLVMDSGIMTGVDMVKALALGADFVMLGRAFLYGVAALGARGGDQVTGILQEDLVNVMTQLGCPDIGSLRQVGIVPAHRP